LTGFAEEPRRAEDLRAWHVLRPLLDSGGYLPWRTGAMRPVAFGVVCSEVVHGGPHAGRRVWQRREDGRSRAPAARARRGLGRGRRARRRLAALVADVLRREALDGVARVLHAPLEGDPPWYAPAALDALPADVDLLVVDGPPAHAAGHEHRRAPALPFFEARLVPGATVVLDDLQRPGERNVLARWEAETPWRFRVDEAAGVAVGARG